MARVYVKTAWWFKWFYVPALWLMARMGIEPDWDKVEATLGRALFIEVERV